ncbi:hypothetical protein HPP92_013347 [Vanilla planifolia]|uniref:ATPase inhibitor n=1 Tax=Vanilla planifolia TaxID=51239 RepID=A0A835UYQ3_VANPL|nr:hypothetical protein HPP92_013347 [Vanilla planifolia]
MPTKFMLAGLTRLRRSPAASVVRTSRWFSDGKGRILSEEEKAAENIYIQKMERERMEKLKQKAEKEKAQEEKEKTEKVLQVLLV